MPAINEVFWANEANVVVAKIKYNNGSPFFFYPAYDLLLKLWTTFTIKNEIVNAPGRWRIL